MDEPAIRAALAAALPAAERELMPRLKENYPLLPMALNTSDHDIANIQNLFDQIPEFKTFCGHIECYGTPLSSSGLFVPFLRVSLENGPDAGIDWLKKVVINPPAEAKCYFLFSGLCDVKAPIELCADWYLAPYSSLEPTHHVEMFRPIAQGSGNWTQYQLPANNVLIRHVRLPKIATKNPTIYDLLREMEYVVHLLGICHNSIRPETGWTEYVDPDFRKLEVGVGFFPAVMDSRARMAIQERPKPRTYRRLMSAFNKLAPDEWSLLQIAAQRLGEAKQRNRRGDQAIEAAISLEALVGNQSDNQELSKTVRTRSALVLGGGFDKRHVNRDAVRNLYNVRSSMVHTGRVKSKLDTDNSVNPGVRVARKVLLARLLYGKPDWDCLELMGNHPPTPPSPRSG